MVLPLGAAGVQQIDREESLLPAMQSTLTSPGFYLFPKMTPGNSPSEYQAKIANGPSGMLVYFPRRDVAFGRSLGYEFGTELIQALIAASLLGMTTAVTFGRRLGIYVLAGAIAAVATNVSYWNWYGFPSAYTSAYMFTIWMGYICAGLIAAAMKIGGPARSAAAPA
jgi:hypothetical protein